MDAHVSLITIATADLERSRAFYVGGLGWPEKLFVPGDVLFIQVNHGLLLSLFDSRAFNQDLLRDAVPAPLSGVALAQNLDSASAVDQVIETALNAGAALVKPPQRASWGGYHAAFEDPCGLIWEIAHNPGLRFNADGSVAFTG